MSKLRQEVKEAPIWRPSRSLDSFDEKELVVRDTRHRIFRVFDKETWFAIKEYHIEQAGDLRRCLKEAAIVYRHRHLNVVEIKALFLGTEDTRNTYLLLYADVVVQAWVSGQMGAWRPTV